MSQPREAPHKDYLRPLLLQWRWGLRDPIILSVKWNKYNHSPLLDFKKNQRPENKLLVRTQGKAEADLELSSWLLISDSF